MRGSLDCIRTRNILGEHLDYTVVYYFVWKIEMGNLLTALAHGEILLEVRINPCFHNFDFKWQMTGTGDYFNVW